MSDQTWIPEPSEASKPFFDGAGEGKLRLQVCTRCNTWAYPPATICTNCGSHELEWRES